MVKLIKVRDSKNDVEAYAKVPSESNSIVFYFVVKYKDGKVGCNCGDFMFRRHKCKHIVKTFGKQRTERIKIR